ncbi:MAG: lytic transglycosylase domain-containing protein [Verrucomicrobiota bacterium]
MKFVVTGFAIFLLSATAFAQKEIVVEPGEVIGSAEEFLESLDEDALKLMGVDVEEAKRFLVDLKKGFEGTYVYDLSALRETAAQLLPVLEQFEESAPYASWLKTHLDYFVVAEKLRKEASRVSTNKISLLPAPSAKVERKAWIEVVEEKPMPPLAFKQIAQLKKIFIAERVPPELVWLAEVESSFDTKARSPAGAAGLFQLMPVTARSLNLSVGLLRDERLHPEKNARAAAHYLRQLYGRFGDWRLALAAYNAGEGRVAALLKKHNARTFDEIANRLPAETQMYVPKVEATIRKREGRALADLKMPKG